MKQSKGNNPLALKLGLVSAAMFAFGFAMVPMYDVFCELTGLNGKTGRADTERVAQYVPDVNRTVSVEFLASLNQSLNWDFYPVVNKLEVHPGQPYTVNYFVKNKTPHRVVAQAVPSVSPVRASAYFDKMECFCFTEQIFEPGQERELTVSFVVAPKLPDNVKTISLAYTFFDISDTVTDGV